MLQNPLQIYSDEELMGLLKVGNVKAFDELYLRYAKRLKHYFFRMLDNNNELADDFLQEVMLKLCSEHARFNADKQFKTWIFSIAHNLCKNYYRHKSVVEKHQASILDLPNYNTALNTISAFDEMFIRTMLQNALLKLSIEKREIVLLRFQEEKSLSEIAEITGLAEGTVKSRLHYALQQLAELLKHHKTEIN